MNKTWYIRGISDAVKLKLRLLAAGRGTTIGQLLTELADKAWLEDNTQPDKRAARKMKRIIEKYKHVAHVLGGE